MAPSRDCRICGQSFTDTRYTRCAPCRRAARAQESAQLSQPTAQLSQPTAQLSQLTAQLSQPTAQLSQPTAQLPQPPRECRDCGLRQSLRTEELGVLGGLFFIMFIKLFILITLL